MTTNLTASGRRLAAGAGRGDAEPAGGAGRPARPDRRLWRRADRDDLSAADLGRAGAESMVVGGPDGGPARPGRSRTSSPSRSPAIGLDCTACTVRGLRRLGRAPRPGAALDGPAGLPRGRGHQRHRRPGPAVRLGPGLARVDAAQGALAQAERARALSIGRADRRGHRLDDVSPDRRLDAVAESRRGQMELRAAGRRLAGRLARGGRAGRPAGEMAGSGSCPLGRGEGRLSRIGGRGPRPAGGTSRSPRAGSTPTWGCSAWARPRTATWP